MAEGRGGIDEGKDFDGDVDEGREGVLGAVGDEEDCVWGEEIFDGGGFCVGVGSKVQVGCD